MKIAEITRFLEELAPLSSQESYDNAGLIVGNPELEVSNALITLDCTEEIIDEAIAKGCNLVIAHHPIVFKGLKSFTGKTYVERTVIKAIENKIAIYAIHTNLDHYKWGVNKRIGDLLGIKNTRVLSPTTQTLHKLAVFVPASHAREVLEVLFENGAGGIGEYSECSFQSKGNGTYKPSELTTPFKGEKGYRHTEEEVKIEVLISKHKSNTCIQKMIAAHPYEEVAYDLIPILNNNPNEGAGMIGELEKPQAERDFLAHLKATFKCEIIRHTALSGKPIKTVAWCGGAGSFLLNNAKAQRADIFITGDFKYHEFFDAENQIIIADIGHFESEQYTIDLLGDILTKKFVTFAPCLTEINTNPVKYF